MKSRNCLVRLLPFLAPYKGKVVLATICSLFNKLCDIVPEILIGISIDVVVNQECSLVAQLGITNPFEQLYIIGAFTALLWILESVFEYWYAILWRSVAYSIQHDIRIKTYTHIQALDLSSFAHTTTGSLLAIAHDEVHQLEEFLSEAPNAIIQLVVNVLALGTIFIWLSPIIALCAMLPIPFVVLIAYYFHDHLALLYATVRDRAGVLASHVAHRLQGIAIIKSYVTESYEVARVCDESSLYTRAQYQAGRMNAAYIPTVRMGIMVGFISSLIMGGRYALLGLLPINWYAALVFLTQRFLWPFTTITTITDMYEKTMASVRRIVALLDTPTTIKSGSIAFPSGIQGIVQFDNVSFSYIPEKTLLQNLSFTIPARHTVAFVGATGSGKSTIIKLLLRFYDTITGIISIDTHNIKTVTLDSLRHAIALVSQETYLVDGTVADNISYGTFNATEDEIVHAATLAESHAFIMQLPQRYNTVVGEHGKNLSGGQRQRIAIARALLKKAPILIFDEATSAVDNETEAAIQKSFARLAHTHTMIIIAHRLSTVRNADTIFVMDQGSIVETGTHEELLKNNGTYARLWKLQTGA